MSSTALTISNPAKNHRIRLRSARKSLLTYRDNGTSGF